jgi:hypothetical protein
MAAVAVGTRAGSEGRAEARWAKWIAWHEVTVPPGSFSQNRPAAVAASFGREFEGSLAVATIVSRTAGRPTRSRIGRTVASCCRVTS